MILVGHLTSLLPIALADEPITAAAPPSAPATLPPLTPSVVDQALNILYNHIGVFMAAFVVTLILTPVMRRLAIAHGVVDHPIEARKQHRVPVAYLGGVAVTVGVLAGIVFSFVGPMTSSPSFPFNLMTPLDDSVVEQHPMPWSVLLGLTLIMLTGLIDDVAKLDPRLKVAGQLLAAAALAMNDVGVRVASGFLTPIGKLVGNEHLLYHVPLPFHISFIPSGQIEVDLIYWAGTAVIAVFVLGACNSSNLIDGLDGLLSGVTAIAAAGLLVIALGMAVAHDGPLDSTRLVLCLALLGACLGFLPHNFNPATIFLGDCGSLTLGYLTIVIVLMLGDTGKTQLVIAGLVIYAIPIIDTVLAIVRRKLAGKPMSVGDDQHLHHQLKRAFGVRGAVLTLYIIGIVFAALGIWLSMGRLRAVATIAFVFSAFIGVTAVKTARRQAHEAQLKSAGYGADEPDLAPVASSLAAPSSKRAPEPAAEKRKHEPTPAR